MMIRKLNKTGLETLPLFILYPLSIKRHNNILDKIN